MVLTGYSNTRRDKKYLGVHQGYTLRAAELMIKNRITYLLEHVMAERVGFEPTGPVNVRWFSRPVHSTTLPPLQCRAIKQREDT